MQNEVPKLNLPSTNEPYPGHVTIWRTYGRTVIFRRTTLRLEKTLLLCIKEADWKKGIIGSDSTGAETDRYETVVRPNKKKKCFE